MILAPFTYKYRGLQGGVPCYWNIGHSVSDHTCKQNNEIRLWGIFFLCVTFYLFIWYKLTFHKKFWIMPWISSILKTHLFFIKTHFLQIYLLFPVRDGVSCIKAPYALWGLTFTNSDDFGGEFLSTPLFSLARKLLRFFFCLWFFNWYMLFYSCLA